MMNVVTGRATSTLTDYVNVATHNVSGDVRAGDLASVSPVKMSSPMDSVRNIAIKFNTRYVAVCHF